MKKILFLIGCSLCLMACHQKPEPAMSLKPDDAPIVWVDTTLLPCDEEQIAFLSVYPSPELLLTNGDDDEAAAWLWMHETYPMAQFLYFGDIRSQESLSNLKALFWLRDLETDSIDDVFTFPAEVLAATPFISDWYRDGGNLILWGHAVVYTENLGRLPVNSYRDSTHDAVISCGQGFFDASHWLLSVQLFPGGKFKKDHTTHPLFRNLPIYSNNDLRGFMVKGPGWTENHNCVFYNYPSQLTGRSWQQEICYRLLTEYFGIYPLAVWDSQIAWVSQLNVYELRKGQTDFNGRIICIGNGGCEFSMKSYRQIGTDPVTSAPIYETMPDITPCPTNNIYQKNILQMAANAIEYMRL